MGSYELSDLCSFKRNNVKKSTVYSAIFLERSVKPSVELRISSGFRTINRLFLRFAHPLGLFGR
jgi:hypothetical protein